MDGPQRVLAAIAELEAYRACLHESLCIYLLCTKGPAISEVNAALVQMTGRKDLEGLPVGRWFEEIVHPEDRARTLEYWMHSVEKGVPSIHFENRILAAPDITPRWNGARSTTHLGICPGHWGPNVDARSEFLAFLEHVNGLRASIDGLQREIHRLELSVTRQETVAAAVSDLTDALRTVSDDVRELQAWRWRVAGYAAAATAGGAFLGTVIVSVIPMMWGS